MARNQLGSALTSARASVNWKTLRNVRIPSTKILLRKILLQQMWLQFEGFAGGGVPCGETAGTEGAVSQICEVWL